MVAADSEYEKGSQTRTRHPDRSAKSTDRGASWDFEHLGWKNEVDGEYAIRLSLDRYAPEGLYVSPVIALAAAIVLVVSSARSHSLPSMSEPKWESSRSGRG